MQSFILLLRSIVFYLCVILLTISLTPLVLISFLITNRCLLIPLTKFWTKSVTHLLYLCCNLSVEVKGLKYIQKEPVIIAAKHQSAIEAFAFYHYLNNPRFILKSSLFYIPILGICWYKQGQIFINRNKKISALKDIKAKAREVLNSGDSVVIFPEGTRTEFGDHANKYNPGIFYISKEINYKVIPCKVNTGKFWPKNSITKYPGKAVIEFLPELSKSNDKETFLKNLKDSLENQK